MIASTQSQIQFLRGNPSITALLSALLDPCAAVLTLFAAVAYFGESFDSRYVVLSLLTFSVMFPGRLDFSRRLRAVLRDICINWFVVFALLVFIGWGTRYIKAFPQILLLVWLIGTPVVLFALHALLRALLPDILSMQQYQRHAIVIGATELSARLVSQFTRLPHLGVRVVGFFDDRARDRLKHLNDLPLCGVLSDVANYVKSNSVDSIYIALPMASQPRVLSLLDELRDTTASIYFVPDVFLADLIQARMDQVNGVPVVAVCETPFVGVNGAIKRAADLTISALALVALMPALVLIAAGVKLSSPGPILFKQRRYGLDGKEITVYKFRSMTVCEDGDTIRQATKNDRRVTRLGGFLRRTSLDELPQLINVLQGRMSLVGPRPHAVAHNEMYRKMIKGYMIRHKVKPGITGWAQVHGYRGETDTLDKMRGRIEYDLAYLRSWSLKLDIYIMLRTLLLVLKDSKAY